MSCRYEKPKDTKCPLLRLKYEVNSSREEKMDKNEQNQTTTSYEQDEVLEFYEGLAAVKKCFDRGFIHKGGELLQHYEWDGGCKCGFIDTSGLS